MKIKKFNELNENSNQHKIESVNMEAQEAFWSVITKSFPEITSGNFSPEDTFDFDDACEKAIRRWVEFNM